MTHTSDRSRKTGLMQELNILSFVTSGAYLPSHRSLSISIAVRQVFLLLLSSVAYRTLPVYLFA